MLNTKNRGSGGDFMTSILILPDVLQIFPGNHKYTCLAFDIAVNLICS
jgi:hypothetical protein